MKVKAAATRASQRRGYTYPFACVDGGGNCLSDVMATRVINPHVAARCALGGRATFFEIQSANDIESSPTTVAPQLQCSHERAACGATTRWPSES